MSRSTSVLLRSRRLALTAAVVVGTLTVDLTSKAWAWDVLRVRGPRPVVQGMLHLEFAFNTGGSFGMLRDASFGPITFVAMGAVVLLATVGLARLLPPTMTSAFVGVGLIGGGTLGNLHDRLFRELLIVGEGFRPGVVDFIVVRYGDARRWPAFNLADVALIVGAALVLGMLWRLRWATTSPPEG